MRLHAIVAALTIFIFSPAVLALSLGEAKTESHLNQPLKAQIVVRAVKNDERDTIRAIIPPAEKFRKAGIRRDVLVENIRLDVVDGTAEDELLIYVTTEQRIKEPFLNFLVEVRWLGGSVMREYTLLLDPAPIANQRNAGQQQAEADRPLLEPRQDSASSAQDVSGNTPTYSAPAGNSRSYGPVRRHETLWSIAFSQRTDPSITMDQMQLAIYQANPQAFDGNINTMRTGSTLVIPPNNEIRAIEPAYAKREVAQQRRGYHPPAPKAYTPPPPPSPEVSEPAEEAPVEEEQAEPVVEAPEPASQAEAETQASEQEAATSADASESEAKTSDDAGTEDSSIAEAGAVAVGAAEEEQTLSEDELVAEGEQPEVDSGEIEMPSVWAEGEEPASDAAGENAPQETAADSEAEQVVEQAPPESSGALGAVTALVSPVTLILALVLILALLGTYWWYRKRKVTDVGAQFAYAGPDEDEGEGKDAQADADSADGETSSSEPSSVWGDEESIPDSIDEYTASTPGADELDLDDATAPPVEAESMLDVGEDSPIRDMSNEEIDYLGEADVHLAYGLYDEAASVLQRGITETPSRDDLRLKLLEVYHSGGMASEFLSAAQDWKNAGVSNEADWAKATQMGAEIAPDSDLFQGAETVISPTITTEAPAEESADTVAELDASPVTEDAPSTDGNLDFDLSNFDLDSPADVSADASQEEAGQPEVASATLEPDEGSDTLGETDENEAEDQAVIDMPAPDQEPLDLSELDTPVATTDDEAPAESPPAPDIAEAAEVAEEDDGLEFDLEGLSLSDDAEAQEETPVPDEAETELPEFSLDDEPDDGDQLEALKPAEEMDRQPEEQEAQRVEPELDESLPGEEEAALSVMADEPISDDPVLDEPPSGNAGGDEEASVKLDLARAYLDMGEPDMAKTLLDEVMDMGNEQQRQEAQELLSRSS